MNIYLDINGTMLGTGGEPVENLAEFLKYATENHDVYWLTTLCKNGDCSSAVEIISRVLPPEIMRYIQKIKPTSWQTLKTEAIDFSEDFRWFDDYVMDSEIEVLKKNNALNKLILKNFGEGFEKNFKII